jgi:uncharacterized membrane protein
VAALRAGEAGDPRDGARGKQRSVHNTYFTLPVVFAMLSTHWAPLHAARASWLVLALGMMAGRVIREFFVRWHSGARDWWLLAAAALPSRSCCGGSRRPRRRRRLPPAPRPPRPRSG